MTKAGQGSVLSQIHALFHVGAVASLTDGQLLELFLDRCDAAEPAFEALVRRHGPMVLRVCRGVLQNAADADDAFQATFLVLVRKAGSIQKRDSVASWLHGVAARVAACARAEANRRAAREHKAAAMRPSPVSAEPVDQSDLERILPAEVSRLPDKYRAAVVLCYLEGRTHEEAAAQLRWPVGTVRSRLARARERLKARLIHRGLAPAAIAVVFAAATDAQAAVPERLVQVTIKTAIAYAASRTATAGAVAATVLALQQGALRAMFTTKLKLVVLATAGLVVVAAGAVTLAYPGQANAPSAAGKEAKSSDRAEKPREATPAAGSANLAAAARTLLEQRAKTAREIYQFELQRLQRGEVGVDAGASLEEWSRHWMEDEVRLAANAAGRIAARQAHVDRMKKVEEIFKGYANAGEGRISDALKATYFRLEAEQLLEEEKAAQPAGEPKK